MNEKVGIAKIVISMIRPRSTPYLKIRGSRIRIIKSMAVIVPIVELASSPNTKFPLIIESTDVITNEKNPPLMMNPRLRIYLLRTNCFFVIGNERA